MSPFVYFGRKKLYNIEKYFNKAINSENWKYEKFGNWINVWKKLKNVKFWKKNEKFWKKNEKFWKKNEKFLEWFKKWQFLKTKKFQMIKNGIFWKNKWKFSGKSFL